MSHMSTKAGTAVVLGLVVALATVLLGVPDLALLLG